MVPKKSNSLSHRLEFWEERAELIRVLSHPVRLLILEELCTASRCVKELNKLVSINQPNLSQHMAVLRKAGIVGSHVSGSLRCYYLLRPSLVIRIIETLSKNHEAKIQSREKVIREVKQAIKKTSNKSKK